MNILISKFGFIFLPKTNTNKLGSQVEDEYEYEYICVNKEGQKRPECHTTVGSSVYFAEKRPEACNRKVR